MVSRRLRFATDVEEFMFVPILVCDCGMRVKAPGARPGRVGRCPRCGGRLEVPESLPVEATQQPDGDQPMSAGFDVGPDQAAAFAPAVSRPKIRRSRREPASVPERLAAPADGLLPALAKPETSWFASFLYPARGAECLGVLAGTALIFWVFFVLVPEYCVTMVAEATSMGAWILGMLFVTICTLPVVILAPFVTSYWLQYLGRVLVASAMGETAPPRSPDRNFDGFFNGLSPWCIWLALGLGVGLLPLGCYLNSVAAGAHSPWIVVELALVGLPYCLTALMMSFLHDHPLAAMPWGVVVGLFRLGRRFLALTALIAGTIALVAVIFAMALMLRSRLFWIYLLLCLPCCAVLQWNSVAVMRLLGTYYFHHRKVLRWHRADPRWGVAWRL
jgi:hypothetical protein